MCCRSVSRRALTQEKMDRILRLGDAVFFAGAEHKHSSLEVSKGFRIVVVS